MNFAEQLKNFFTTRLKRLSTPRQPGDLAALVKKHTQIDPVQKWNKIEITPQTSNEPIISPVNRVVVGFIPLTIPTEQEKPVNIANKPENTSSRFTSEILKITKKPSPAIRINFNLLDEPIVGISTQEITHPNGSYQIEEIELPLDQIHGIRVSENREAIEKCGDALSITIFHFVGPNGVENRVRLLFVADGVGESAVGDYAAKILTSKAQEYCVQQIKTGNIKKTEALQGLIAQASAYADEYFHSIPPDSFREAYVNDTRDMPDLMKIGVLNNFDEKAKRGELSSSTLLALAVVDKPSLPESPLSIIYQDGGDGGFDVSAGYNYENFCLPHDYKSGIAPEQINYNNLPRDSSFYSKLINQWQFDRQKEAEFTITLRTDGLDKLQVGGKERTAGEMLDLALELSAVDKPIPVLAMMADGVGDDVTYLMMKG